MKSYQPLSLLSLAFLGVLGSQEFSSQRLTGARVLTPEQQEILSHLSIVHLDDGSGNLLKTLRVEGINLQVVDGQGELPAFTRVPNGLGNVIVGYNEARPAGGDVRSGSHSLVLGRGQNYSSYGALLGGHFNEASAPHTSVLAGVSNRAIALGSSVVAGSGNTASQSNSVVIGGSQNSSPGNESVVVGGESNTAVGRADVIVGGQLNQTTGPFTGFCVVVGGSSNAASGVRNVVVSGALNQATGEGASVLGGNDNLASGTWASVVGGRNNTASGNYSSVGGGAERAATGVGSWAAGSLSEPQ